MSQKLLIIGAGNIGGYISYNIKDFGEFEIVGFLDDDLTKIGRQIYGNYVLGPISSIDEYLKDDATAVVIGIGNPAVKNKIADELKNKNVFFPNFISKNVWISEKVEIGTGVILYPGVAINYETKLGDFVIMNMNCSIGHNCSIGAFSTMAPGVQLAGFTTVDESADIGIGAATIQRVRIGKSSKIGGMTMVIRNVPDYAVVVGNPARTLRIMPH